MEKESAYTMEHIVTLAIDNFKIKLADTIFNNMVDECFIEENDEEKERIVKLIASAKYNADKQRLTFYTRDYLMSSIAKILEHISIDLYKYITDIYFCAKPTDKYTVFNMQIDIELGIPNVVELYYMQKAQAKLDL